MSLDQNDFAVISGVLIGDLLHRAAVSPAREICGLLLGRGDRIALAPPAANVAEDDRDSFEVDPAALIAAHRAQRAGGPCVLGHYHSHPGGRPMPSIRDRMAAEPGPLWLIIGSGEARLWRAAANGFRAMRLVVEHLDGCVCAR